MCVFLQHKDEEKMQNINETGEKILPSSSSSAIFDNDVNCDNLSQLNNISSDVSQQISKTIIDSVNSVEIKSRRKSDLDALVSSHVAVLL